VYFTTPKPYPAHAPPTPNYNNFSHPSPVDLLFFPPSQQNTDHETNHQTTTDKKLAAQHRLLAVKPPLDSPFAHFLSTLLETHRGRLFLLFYRQNEDGTPRGPPSPQQSGPQAQTHGH
jgi:hypothetical protein